jgi:hypothetical protein
MKTAVPCVLYHSHFLKDTIENYIFLFYLIKSQLRLPLEENFEQEFQGDISKTAWDVMKHYIATEKVSPVHQNWGHQWLKP